MIVVKDKERYDAMCHKAIHCMAMANLQECIDYLDTYANRPGCTYDKEGTVCELYGDFAEASMQFVMKKPDGKGGWQFWFNGGLIFHPGSSGPDVSLSVELCGSDKPHWSIHT